GSAWSAPSARPRRSVRLLRNAPRCGTRVGRAAREVSGESRDFFGRPLGMGSRPNAAPDRAVRFGRYTLDRDGLWRGKQEVRLTPKALAVLRVLVDRAGRLVSKQDLLETVWSGTAVSDAALSSCIQEIRQ